MNDPRNGGSHFGFKTLSAIVFVERYKFKKKKK